MKELNESVDRYDVSCHCGAVYVRSKQDGHLVMYSDYAALERRAEEAEAALAEEKRINEKLREDRAGLARECNAFEAKLAELEKQEPAGKFAFEPLAKRYHHIKHGEAQNMEPKLPLVKLFTRPVPAINLAELVLDENDNPEGFISWYERHFAMYPYKGSSHVADCENAWRAAILSNIEEQSQ